MNDDMTEISDAVLAEQIRRRFDRLTAERDAITARLPAIEAQLRDCAAAARVFGVEIVLPIAFAKRGSSNGGPLQPNSKSSQLLTELEKVAPDGRTYKELSAQTGISTNWVSARLTQLKARGDIRVDNGRWFAVAREARP